MQLTSQGQQAINELAAKYNLDQTAITAMLEAVAQGGGTMAQFNIPALGGGGQWMQGGMTMVGDMFNYNLKSLVDNLCNDLSQLLATTKVYKKPAVSSANSWYPSELGIPTASGSQNSLRYAYFANKQRLALDYHGEISVYDTLNHQISGFSQQQGNSNYVQFTSQYGLVNTLSLPLLSGRGTLPSSTEQPVEQSTPQSSENLADSKASDIFSAIEKLGALHKKGILTDEEFQTKKQELLGRL